MKIINIVGARPNFMKIAPIIREMDKHPDIEHLLLHTGQHYDHKMSKFFFEELGIPKPNINLNIGSDTHARQVARIMTAFEEVCDTHQPDLILVVGDVNSTMACSLVAVKKGIKTAHVEAGIRSYDRNMPEEINRLVTDAIVDYLLPPSPDAVENLKQEGHAPEKIHLVGNVMIDTLKLFQPQIQASNILEELGVEKGKYATLTLHRPSNVDDEVALKRILKALQEIQQSIKIVFPMHPRTKKMLEKFGLEEAITKMSNLIVTEPLGYLGFGKLISNSKMVLTDSGGIQEETTVYEVPCITLRENTERPITITEGTNELAGSDTDKILAYAETIFKGEWKTGSIPKLWDGKASERIVQVVQH